MPPRPGRRAALAVAASLLAPATVLAHADADHADGVPWTLDAWVTVPLLLALAWFTLGVLRLRGRAGHRPAHGRQALWFYAGWLVMAAALVTPLHAAGERSFTLHMLEHELLMLVAAPMLVLARPVGIGLWALPGRWRGPVGRLALQRWFARAWRGLADPLVASVLQMLALWVWHAPALFDLALRSDGWHIAQHVSFVATALLFWTAMLQGGRLRARTGTAAACLFATAVLGGALGALMALSDSPWYQGYRAMGMAPFGLSPAEDQQLAGLLMWVPGGLVHVLAALLLLARWLREEPPPARRSGRAAAQEGTPAPAAHRRACVPRS